MVPYRHVEVERVERCDSCVARQKRRQELTDFGYRVFKATPWLGWTSYGTVKLWQCVPEDAGVFLVLGVFGLTLVALVVAGACCTYIKDGT